MALTLPKAQHHKTRRQGAKAIILLLLLLLFIIIIFIIMANLIFAQKVHNIVLMHKQSCGFLKRKVKKTLL